MTQLFEGEVYDILPLSNGIIFSYCKETNDTSVLVSYRMLSFDNGNFSNVENDVYLITKFGNNYRAVAELCENYIKVKSIVMPSGKVFLLQPDGTAQLLDNDATPVWTGSLIYKNAIPSDIALNGDYLWVAYPDLNIILSYNLSTMKAEIRIGGKNSPFARPRNISIKDDVLTVCSLDSKSLLEINLKTYKILKSEEFDEPIYQYLKVDNNRFALLHSGLYLL